MKFPLLSCVKEFCRVLIPLMPFLLVLAMLSPLSAQIFPVQSNVIITPPYSPYLSDYTAPGSQRFMVQLRANDATLSDYVVKLRLTIEGVGITIRTKQNIVLQPLTIQG